MILGGTAVAQVCGDGSMDGGESCALRQLVPGRAPDLDPRGRYVAFESTANLDVDPRTTRENSDGSQEVFLLDFEPAPRHLPIDGVCVAGPTPCDLDDVANCRRCFDDDDCRGRRGGSEGWCVDVIQISSGDTSKFSGHPRLTAGGKNIIFASTADELADNADGSREIRVWSREALENSAPPLSALTNAAPPVDDDHPAPSLNAKYVFVESTADSLGTNPDGNREIFVYKPRSGEWLQITNTLPPVENLRPATVSGQRVVWESTANLTGQNADNDWVIYMYDRKRKKTEPPGIADSPERVADSPLRARGMRAPIMVTRDRVTGHW